MLIKDLEDFIKGKGFKLLDFQKRAIVLTHSRRNTLIISPTGTGKTYGAFFGILNELFDFKKRNGLENKVYSVYISPLRALTYDIEKNLKEILEFAQMNDIRIAIWTSDIKNKTKYKTEKPHIILTTPESFGNIITKDEFLTFDWIIVDEIHSMIENKRGVYLDLLLKYAKTQRFFSLTYLTATDYSNMMNFIDVEEVVKNNIEKKIVTFVLPSDNLDNSINEIIKIKQKYSFKTIIIFTNTRPLAELIGIELKKKKFLTEVHHSSLGYRVRKDIENRLKKGKLDFVVSSTSLELGIDIGYIDATVLFGSPKTITKALQRIGRSGHCLGCKSYGFFISLNIRDLLEIVGIVNGIKKGIKEALNPIENPLDVLAHFILLISFINKEVLSGNLNRKPMGEFEIYDLVKTSVFYKDFSYEDYLYVIKFYEDKKYVKREKINGIYYPVLKLPAYRLLSNLGPIPKQDYYVVKHKNRIIGYLDREYGDYLLKDDSFSLGAKFYVLDHFEDDKIVVREAKQGEITKWYSSYLPISPEVGNQIVNFVAKTFEVFKDYKIDEIFFDSKADVIIKKIKQHFEFFDRKLYEYLKRVYLFFLPNVDFKNFIVEDFKLNKHFIVVHTFLGKRFNDALSRIMASLVSKSDVEIGIDDLSFYLAADKLNVSNVLNIKKFDCEKLYRLIEASIEKTLSYKRRLRQMTKKLVFVSEFYNILSKGLPEREVKRELIQDYLDFKNLCKALRSRDFEIMYLDVPSPLAQTLFENSYKDLFMNQSKDEFIKEIKNLIDVKINLKLGKIIKN